MRRASLLLLLFALLFPAACITQSQQRPAITGIAFVRMYTADPAASQAFYSGKLGYDRTTANGIAIYPINDAQSLEVEPLPTPAPQSRVAAIAFTTRDAAALQRYLKAHSIKIDQPLHHGSFAVHDPEGNLIFFVQQHPASSKSISPRAASHRLIHTGFSVQDPSAENRFYRDLLGFRPYWHGGRKDGETDYISSQVPDGDDWIEFMLNRGPDPTPAQLGSDYHVSLGMAHMSDAIQALARNGCTTRDCTAANTHTGRDGKVQLNLFDPDLTRVEYMEFQPSGVTCCSPFTGKHPTETEAR